jgi:hypothetical protein
MSDGPDTPQDSPFRYHLELTPPQLKITHTALRSLLDDFGHDEPKILEIIHEVLAKLPDEHAIRAIQLDGEGAGEPGAAASEAGGEGDGDEPSPAAA